MFSRMSASETTVSWHRHIACCTFPFGTHAAPLLLLVRHLAAASPTTLFTFLGTQDSNSHVFKKGSSSSPLPNNIVLQPVHDGVPPGHVFSGHYGEPIGLFLRAGKESFRNGMDEAEAVVGVRISCVLSDAFLWFCGELAEERAATWVAFWTSGAAAVSAHLHTDLFRKEIGTQGVEARKDELVGIVPGFSTVRLHDLPEGVVLGDFSNPFSQMLHNMAIALPRATATAVNSYEELEIELVEDLKTKLKNYLNVGPFPLLFPPQGTKSDDYGCIPFLEGRDHASVAYVSFGTVATLPPHELVALADAVEVSRITFIWSLNDKAAEHLPEGFKERTEGRGKVVPWAPQVALLAHPATGVFITHGGWNSIIESIIAGVPMICRPFLGDQMLNTRFIETVWRIGTGVEVDVFTKTGTLAALEKVIRTEEGKQMRANVTVLKGLAEAAVQPNGSSIKNMESLIKLVTE
ncbi:hypothetical protein Drorol1_Dr00001478 [Drosera rotundifolia]